MPAPITALFTPEGMRVAKQWLDEQPTTLVLLVIAVLWLGGDKLMSLADSITGTGRILDRIEKLETRVVGLLQGRDSSTGGTVHEDE